MTTTALLLFIILWSVIFAYLVWLSIQQVRLHEEIQKKKK